MFDEIREYREIFFFWKMAQKKLKMKNVNKKLIKKNTII